MNPCVILRCVHFMINYTLDLSFKLIHCNLIDKIIVCLFVFCLSAVRQSARGKSVFGESRFLEDPTGRPLDQAAEIWGHLMLRGHKTSKWHDTEECY